jgi:phospholipid/cholesterol/gamma-HCH transport system ATP-binding protein
MMDAHATGRTGTPEPHDEATIRVEHLTKSFGGRMVLDDVSFAVRAGTAFCLLGRSGTGKSVTLKHIIGLIKPDSGCVLVEGEDVPTLDRRHLSRVRKRMGFLFQEGALFDSITVGENVAFPLRRHTDLSNEEIVRRARARLEAVGLGREYDRMPAHLSGGMRKRAALARAMALDPPILLVDEPSAGLDPITSDEIDALLLHAKRDEGKTLVVVTHNIPSARTLGDELALLDGGRLVERGTSTDLERSDNPLCRQFMRAQGGG